jgi:two-component system OmpR family response regulator
MSPAGQRPRVLVVDDEPSLADIVATALEHVGLDAATAATGEEALRRVAQWRPDALVLDVMLPDLDGFAVAERMTAEGHDVPIVFLTARADPRERVYGLTHGGEDYVCKPFSLEELLARVNNLLRQRGLTGGPRVWQVADVRLDESAHEATRAGHPLELTATELRLLRELIVQPRRVLTRAQLLDRVWGYDFGGDARVLETYVSYLRKKLDAHGPPLLHTVRGVGYVLREPRS